MTSDAAFEAISKARRQAESNNATGAVNTLEAYLATDPHNTKPRMELAKISIYSLKDLRYGLMQLDIIMDLEPEEARMFMEELGLTERGLDRLIKTSYDLLGYISFLTAGPDDVHAWTIVRGTKAPRAAGKIHSDIERGFIRAEVVAFEDLKACGTMANAKAKGLFRSEGKEYVMKDGDVVNFLFNV